MEDLKAIDEDIEKLRKQIEERDKIISALREAAEAKDKKLDHLMTEYSKLQMDRAAEPECRASLNGDPRARERNLTTTAFSTSPSPPLCNGELCWTDGFVNKNYHEPVYAQLLSDHTALQRIYNELRDRVEARTRPPAGEQCENGINLIMAEQIRVLKEREAQLMSEAEELREQNDLMEFRILELEECRKEEMINEHKHRTEKSIWPERDLEEVSDSGVMSLPTSEDLTSDSELGDTVKNYIHHSDAAIVPTLFPSRCPEPASDLKPGKRSRSQECLQESGIFEDGQPDRQSRASQTESSLDKALLDIIDTSCDLILSKNRGYQRQREAATKSDDLTTEISKLTEIQKRIQEKSDVRTVPQGGSVSGSPAAAPTACPHSKSLLFYEERLGQLEDKLRIYEASGETKDVLLKKRLEKEIELSHRVKELSERVASLEAINRRIEEERCEFEEAENDARFQCQRLEVKVQELMEKNAELEIEIERHRMMMAGDMTRRQKSKSKDVNEEDGLSALEAAMPAIIAWNMFCRSQNKEEAAAAGEEAAPTHLEVPPPPSEANVLDDGDGAELCKSITYPSGDVFEKLEELIVDQKKLRVEYERAEEEARLRETALKQKIEELEAKSSRDRDTLDEMTSYLRMIRSRSGDEMNRKDSSESVPSTQDAEMFEEFKSLAESEAKLRRKIESLERKEQAYLQTLQQADEIWAGMEAEYKKRVAETEEKLRRAEEEILRRQSETEDAARERETLAAELETRREQYVQDKRTIEQLGRELEDKSKALTETLGKLEDSRRSSGEVETALRSQIVELTRELSAKSRDHSNLEVTVAELREEVETLENRVSELIAALESAQNPQTRDDDKATTAAPADEVSGSTSTYSSCLTQVEVERAVRRYVREVLIPGAAEGIPLVVILSAKRHPGPVRLIHIVPALPCPDLVQLSPVPSRADVRSLVGLCERGAGESEHRDVTSLDVQTDPFVTGEENVEVLSLNNQILQSTLEKMEEESRLKDAELAELESAITDIRREQEELVLRLTSRPQVESKATETTSRVLRDDDDDEDDDEEYEDPDCGDGELTAGQATVVESMCQTTEEDTGGGLDVVTIACPVLAKVTAPTMSNLQVALDNLQNKCRIKNAIFRALVDEFKDKFDGGRYGDVIHSLVRSSESSVVDVCGGAVFDGNRTRQRRPFEMLATARGSVQYRDTCATAPITVTRKIGADGLFLEWDVAKQPESVVGYEICVNGDLEHRVRSATRNKALLNNMDFSRSNTICLYAVTERGRSTRCSSVVVPPRVVDSA